MAIFGDEIEVSIGGSIARIGGGYYSCLTLLRGLGIQLTPAQ